MLKSIGIPAFLCLAVLSIGCASTEEAPMNEEELSSEEMASLEPSLEELIRMKLDGATITRNGNMLRVDFDRGLVYGPDETIPSNLIENRLDLVASVLKDFPDVRLQVDGHADISGVNERNDRLAKLRASSAIQYLKVKGVEDTRLGFNSFGDDQPKFTNDTADGRALNRRIEIRLILPEGV